MKGKCKPTWCRVLFAALVLLTLAGSAFAEPLKGNFYLPKDTYWGGTLLAAGQYSLSMDTTLPYIHVQRLGTGESGKYILIAYSEKLSTTAASHLVTVKKGETRMVNVLYSASVQTAFWFNVPEGYSVTTRIIAQNAALPVTEYVPVTFVGK